MLCATHPVIGGSGRLPGPVYEQIKPSQLPTVIGACKVPWERCTPKDEWSKFGRTADWNSAPASACDLVVGMRQGPVIADGGGHGEDLLVGLGQPQAPGARPSRVRRPGYAECSSTTPPAGWVALQYASRRLGVSRQTVLQRVKRGELKAVLTRTGRRKGLRIQVPQAPDALF